MRKSKQEAAVTRRRIIKTAAAAFRKNGIAGTGLSDLMAAAGLTHGGFYRHFDSKDQIVAEACAATMIGAVTISRIVTDSELSAGILREVRKQLVNSR